LLLLAVVLLLLRLVAGTLILLGSCWEYTAHQGPTHPVTLQGAHGFTFCAKW
jgi:hypothetical protein